MNDFSSLHRASYTREHNDGMNVLYRYDEPTGLEDDAPIPQTPLSHWDDRKKNHVDHWRIHVKPIECGPPTSPTNYSNFPSSPVAIVHPAALRVTSTPPYELTSGEGRSASHNDAYHVDDLEWLDGIDEEELSSHESETVDIPVITLARKTGKGHVRWLPSRVKYAFLSASKGLNFPKTPSLSLRLPSFAQRIRSSSTSASPHFNRV